ncbi:MAG: hypothetical protein ACRDRD_12440 [Pseudonocardiaceae bacterium]
MFIVRFQDGYEGTVHDSELSATPALSRDGAICHGNYRRELTMGDKSGLCMWCGRWTESRAEDGLADCNRPDCITERDYTDAPHLTPKPPQARRDYVTDEHFVMPDIYITPTEAIAIRLYKEKDIGSGGDWAIDAVDAEGRYSEACATFATEDEARNAIPEFCASHGIDPALPVRLGA